MNEVPAIGIYLAGTHCSVGVYIQDKVHIVPDEEGNSSIPNYVLFDEDGSVICGKFAKETAYRNTENTIYDVMRIIGRKFNDPELQQNMKSWPFIVKENAGIPKLLVNGKLNCPEEVLGKLLKKLRLMADRFMKFKEGTIRNTVITVPAYFNDGQREAVRDAGRLGGMSVLSILNETTAAALAYYPLDGYNAHRHPRRILIYDMGGRQFDVCILEMRSGTVKTLAVNGDANLGGNDFDTNVAKYCASIFQVEHGMDLCSEIDSSGKQSMESTGSREYRRILRKLNFYCKEAKKQLGSGVIAGISVDVITHGKDLNVKITRAKFEQLNRSYFEKSITLVEDTLRNAGLWKDEIDDVILVGGSTKIPKVQNMLRDFFNGKELRMSIPPQVVVTHGAAIHAAMLNEKQFSDARQTYHTAMDMNFHNYLFILPAQLNEFHTQARDLSMKQCEANSNLSRFQRAVVENTLDTFLETYEKQNDENDYRKLMEIELSNVRTLEELMETHIKVKASTLDRLTRSCSLKDNLLRKEYEWKLRKYIEEGFEEMKYNLAVTGKLSITDMGRNFSKRLLKMSSNGRTPQTMPLTKQQKQDTVQRWASEATLQLKFMIPAVAKQFMQDQLNPKNISDIRTVYDQVLKGVLSEVHKYADAALWNELDVCVDEECRASCTVDLDTVVQQLQKFLLGMKGKLDVVNGAASEDLEKFGNEEILKASRDDLSPGGNSKVGKLVEIGCYKLMDHFRKQNEKIQKNKNNFAEILIREGLNFYDEEMKRLLEEEIYPPEELTKMHEDILGNLIQTLGQPITSITADEEKVAAFKTALETSFVDHLQQNNIRLKKIQAEANNIMQAAKSSYVAKIEVIMKENPDGLDEAELYKRHQKIAQEAVKILERGTQHATVHNEPLHKHQKSFQAYVDEYWNYISEINNLNLKKGKLRGPFTGKAKVTEEKMGGDPDQGHQEEGPEPKMHLDEATVNEKTGREHQLESDLASPSKSRQELLNQCHDIKEQLDGGTDFTFKSGVVKGLFAKRIEEAIVVAKNPDSTKAQIQDQEETLRRWSSRYRK